MTMRSAAATTTTAAPLGPAAAAARARSLRTADGVSPRLRRFTSAVGGSHLTMAGLDAGPAIARPHVYDPFADQALFSRVRESWRTVFTAHPPARAGLLAAGEAGIGVALRTGGRGVAGGYAAVVVPAGPRYLRSVRAVR